VTVPRATRCNRRVAPGRLSLAAPFGRGHPDPAAGVSARRAPSRAHTCAHRRAHRPRTRAPVPSVPDLVRAADPPAVRRTPGAPPAAPPSTTWSRSTTTPVGGATTGDNQSSRGPHGTPGHPRVTKSPTPGAGPIARIVVLATVLLGRIIMRPRESRRVRRRARLNPIKGLRRRTSARPIVGRGRRRRTSRRRRQSGPSGRSRRACQVLKGPPRHDRAGVRHGCAVLLRP